MESAATWRRRAEALLRQARYAEAADAFRREAAIYRRLGDFNAAKVEEAKADRWSSDLRLFAAVPGASPPAEARAAVPAPPAKWEPPYGCYLGAFLDRDENLGAPFLDENGQLHRDPRRFGDLTGKHLASVFCYLSYGRPFPSRWVAWLKRRNVVPHIAWEPNQGLDAVRDDGYLRRFADDAARAECPIFLRFASEMNGDWTRYGGDPLRYKRAWGLVHQVLARQAPNVALVWCVNAVPEPPIPLFYPGDAFVDWVGVNFYSVPFYDNDPARSGEHANPADMLRYVYRQYAPRKPIMVCEYGASRRSAVDGRDRSEWAALKIAQLYSALPRLYPRVKLIDIFNNDNLRHARPGRQLNDYSVTGSDVVRDAYARAVAPDYFLSEVVRASGGGGMTVPSTPARLVPLPAEGGSFPARRGILRVSAWARTYVPWPSVSYALDGVEFFRSRGPGTYEVDLDLTTPGTRRLVATLRDDRGRVALQKQYAISVR